MIVFLDGQFLPAEEAQVSIFDRSFLYGDGLFETVPVFAGRAFRLERHWDRLMQGAAYLGIALPWSLSAIASAIGVLAERNQMPTAVARITLSRGIGPRGYSPRGAKHPRLAISWHPLPEGAGRELAQWSVVTSSQVVPEGQAGTRYKTANKLAAVLATAEAEAAGASEALVLNSAGRVAEAAAANVFWVAHGCVCTPPLAEGALDGITRSVVQQLCQTAGIAPQERGVTVAELAGAEGVFLSLSTLGIVEVCRMAGRDLSRAPVVGELWRRYWDLVQSETGS